ncbi:hypothetical protein OAJ26_00135 [bacterium]|nr:hypothetical protein [bacterium]
MKKSVGGTDSVVEVGGSSSGITSTFTAYEYTATANQTTFSGSDNYSNTLAYNTGTPPKVQVFMNGILLDEGSSQDYTGTNGTSVVLTTGADAGDLIQIHAYKSDVSVSSNINFGDNKKLQFGDAQDLQIYHDGSHSYIRDVGTGNLHIDGTRVILRSASSADMVKAIGAGAVELYHNAIKKFETTSTGVQTTGTVNVNGAYTLPTSDGSSGQALVSDGSGALSFATVITGALTSMSDADGDTKIQVEESSDEDKIRFDANGVEIVRMGFNSSSESTLEIVRNGVPANQGQITFNGSGLITDVTSGYHSLIVRNGGSEHFRVRSNGNVGIGESSPGQKLQVNGNIRADGNFNIGGTVVVTSTRGINAADGTASAPTHTFHSDQDTGMYRVGANHLGFATGGSSRWSIDSSGGITQNGGSNYDYSGGGNFSIRHLTASQNITFATKDSGGTLAEKMRIRGDGNVGIGTTSPSKKFEVHDNGKSFKVGEKSGYAVSYGPVIETNSDAIVMPSTVWVNNSNVRLYKTGTSARLHGDGGIEFGVYNGSAAIEAMRIKNDGKVGIKNTAPAATLEVGTLTSGSTGNVIINSEGGNPPALQVKSRTNRARINIQDNDTSGYIIAEGSVISIGFADQVSDNNININSSHDVGIGTDTPVAKLHIQDNTSTVYDPTGYQHDLFIEKRNTAGNNQVGSIRFGVTGHDGSTTAEASIGVLQTANAHSGNIVFGTRHSGTRAERMRISSDGSVGIGTNAPANLLHVNSGTNDWPIRAQSTDAKAGILIQDNNTTNYLISQSYTLSIGNQASLHANNLNIKSTGNVGIGTISPSEKLEIASNASVNMKLNNTGQNISLAIGAQASAARITAGSGDRLGLGAGNTQDILNIASGGEVGIGTTSPTAHSGTGFVVHATTGGSGNTGSPRIRLTNTTTGQSATDGAELSLDGNTKDFYIENREGQDIIFYSGSERMRIDSSGNFLVGSTSAANSSAGFRAYAGGNGAFTRASTVLDLNRLSTDGTIIQFQKDTVNVGSIGTAGSDIYIAGLDSNHAALRLAASVKAVLPVTHTGALNDNTTNLGQSNARFKDLHLSGKTHIGHAVIDDYAVNTSATSAAQVDTFAAATFRTARYTIQITNTTDSTYHVTELLLIHDGTTPSITEYGTIYTGSASEATFDADIVSGNVRLLATPASSDTMQFKVVRHSILV